MCLRFVLKSVIVHGFVSADLFFERREKFLFFFSGRKSKLLDKAMVEALVCGALAMCLLRVG